MTKIRTLVVDDEPLARRGICLQLKGDPEIEIIGECANGKEAAAAIRKHSPDLVFLDVQMPEMDGFEVIEAVGAERMPMVIFVTAYDHYALRAFEFHAIDYLLKPFDRERFLKALNHAKLSIHHKVVGDINRQLIALLKDRQTERKYLERLVIKSAGRIFFLGVEEIDWIESEHNYIRLYAGRESYLIRDSLKGLEEKLDPDIFLRIRNSTMVNTRRIKELHPLFQGEFLIILNNGKELTSSRRYRQRIKDFIGE